MGTEVVPTLIASSARGKPGATKPRVTPRAIARKIQSVR